MDLSLSGKHNWGAPPHEESILLAILGNSPVEKLGCHPAADLPEDDHSAVEHVCQDCCQTPITLVAWDPIWKRHPRLADLKTLPFPSRILVDGWWDSELFSRLFRAFIGKLSNGLAPVLAQRPFEFNSSQNCLRRWSMQPPTSRRLRHPQG